MSSKTITASSESSSLPASSLQFVVFHTLRISFRSRVVLWCLRRFLRPLLGLMFGGSDKRISKAQLMNAAQRCHDTAGLELAYRVVGKVPGHVLGDLAQTDKPVVLWLHGGAFVLPAAPMVHLPMVAKLSRDLGASASVPDYRLAPGNLFPAALDDCEGAYEALLAKGFPASSIVLGGDSAGGHLSLGLLNRLRAKGRPMPCCALLVSPATELGRIHGPPSRGLNQGKDCLLPAATLASVVRKYIGDRDASDPEISPILMDGENLPPLFFLASGSEILLDDSLVLADRVREAGGEVEAQVWPELPHAFPLFEMILPEAKAGREAITAFAKDKLRGAAEPEVAKAA